MKIIVEISGGVLVSVYTEYVDAEVVLIDHDNLRESTTDEKIKTLTQLKKDKELLEQVYP